MLEAPPVKPNTALFKSLESYLRTMGPAMAERLAKSTRPLYDPERDGVPQRIADLAGKITPLPAQGMAVEACTRCFENGSRVVDLGGEMGSGKTYMGAWIAKLLAAKKGKPFRAVITCPNQLVYKWRNHLRSIVPDWRIIVVESFIQLDEVRRNPRHKSNEVYIISRDRGKLSYSWRLAVNRRQNKRETYDHGADVRVRTRKADFFNLVTKKTEIIEVAADEFCCPTCGVVVKDEVDGEVRPVDLDYFARRGKLRERRRCKACKSPLWEAHNGVMNRQLGYHGIGIVATDDVSLPRPGVAPRRCSPADFAHRKLKRNAFDLYIADEVHELKGSNTLQGGMYGTFAARSKQVLDLTGTLVGGYADNLLYLFWRNREGRMVADDFQYDETGFKDFIRRYGVLRTEKKYTSKSKNTTINDLVLGRGKAKGVKEKTLPGISPVLFANYLLGSAVFIKLQEMHAHLPLFNERVHMIPLTLGQSQGLAQMTQDFENFRKSRRGQPIRCWSAARSVFMRWTDRPWPAHDIMDTDPDGDSIFAFRVPELSPDQEFPKERRLRRLIAVNKAQRRKVWVFTEMTGDRWDVTHRLVDYLGKFGIKAAVLRSEAGGGPNPIDREEWINNVSPGVDVIISNPNLVKTGLDLLAFPTILFYMVGENTYTLRQAARRAWRLGQNQDCRVEYLVCSKPDRLLDPELVPDISSIQSAALSLMSSKLAASMALEGDFSSEGLASMVGDGGDIASQLAKVICGTLTVEDPRLAFARYRESLEKAMPSLARREVAKPLAQVLEPIVEEPIVPEPGQVPAPEPVTVGPAPTPAPVPASKPAALAPPKPEPKPAPAPPPVLPKPEAQADPLLAYSDKQLAAHAAALRSAQTSLFVVGNAAEAGKLASAIDRIDSEARRRRDQALQAVIEAVGAPLDERDGERLKIGGTWYQVVTKARKTVRDRDFTRLNELSPDSLIAFAEPGMPVTFLRLSNWYANRRNDGSLATAMA